MRTEYLNLLGELLRRPEVKIVDEGEPFKLGNHIQRLDPITDPGKRSYAGELKLVRSVGKYVTVPRVGPDRGELELVFHNGELYNEQTFAEIRARSNGTF